MPHPPEYVRSRAGLTYRLNPDGTRTLLVPSGGDGPTDQPDDDTPDEGATSSGAGKVLTQSQIDSIVSRAERRAQADARKTIEETIGMKVDDLASFVEQTRKADEQRMSEAELATKRAQEREQAAAKAQADALDLLATTRVTAAMLRSGVDPKAAERLAQTVRVESDATDDEVAAAVEALRDELPALFGTATTPVPPTPGRGQRPIPKTTPGDDDLEAFAERWVAQQGRSSNLPTL